MAKRLREADPTQDQADYGRYWPTDADLAGTSKYYVVIDDSPGAPRASEAIYDPVGVIKRVYHADGSRTDQMITDLGGWSDTQLLKDIGRDDGPDYTYFQVYEDKLKIILERVGTRPAGDLPE